MVLVVLVVLACFGGFGCFWKGPPGAFLTIPFDFYQILWFLMVLVVLLVLGVLVVSHSIPKEPSIIFFDFHQISNNLQSVHLIIFLLMSLDILRLSSGSHTPTITAKTVLPGIVEATPRTPRHASHHARPRRVTPRTTPRPPPESRKSPDERTRNLSTQVFLVNC